MANDEGAPGAEVPRRDGIGILFLNTRPWAELERVFGAGTWARSLPAAADALEQFRPEAIVVGSEPWAWDFVTSLSPETRPAVLAVGISAEAHAADADEWIASADDPDEAAVRLRLALDRARVRRRASRRAFVDPLTGLPNRRAALRAVMREAGRARRHEGALALVLLDLDNFKAVNERGGHVAGDRLLRRVGSVLRSATRGDELCARIGGDEFAMVIAGSVVAAERAATRIQKALQGTGISATVATSELRPGESLRDLYRRTDDLLHERKAELHGEAGPPSGTRRQLPSDRTAPNTRTGRARVSR